MIDGRKLIARRHILYGFLKWGFVGRYRQGFMSPPDTDTEAELLLDQEMCGIISRWAHHRKGIRSALSLARSARGLHHPCGAE